MDLKQNDVSFVTLVRMLVVLLVAGNLLGLAADKPQEPGAPAVPGRPRMFFGDATRHGRPFAKDPSVLRLGDRYLMYYSMAPSTNKAAPKGWAIGIAESRDLVQWHKAGEILPDQSCENNGLVNGKALLLGGKVHLFYNSYGNGKNDALCHATSDDGLKFTRNPSNPILHPTGDWNSGRAIDCDAFEFGGKLWLIYATRDPSMQTQMLAAASADLKSDFGRAAWTPVGEGPILKPELPWETRCIEAPSVVQRGDTLYLFYGGGYNNDPQQIGCATSTNGRTWTRLFREPVIPNGQPGDWNASETGHPGVFTDSDGRTYLFVQGNNDKGRTWFLSAYELGWEADRPVVLWDSSKFPMKRPDPNADGEGEIHYSQGRRLSMLPPARENTLRSERSDNPTAILFINRTGGELHLFWLDFEGQRQPYGTIGTAESFRRTTYATHAWLVADAAGKPLGLYVAEEKEGVAEIGGATNAIPAAPANTAPAAPAARERDVTFIVTSDVHYDAFENEDRNDRVRDTLRAINAVTNLTWPAELDGGTIAKPRGVLVLGDVIDDGDRVFLGKHQTPRQYYLFAADFGCDGTDGLLNFPVFETWGNHDGPPAGQEKLGFSFQARLKERNARRQQKGWFTNLSTNGLHYSWDWDDVHFVMLGLYPADAQHPLLKRYSPVWHNPQGALAFLKSDLARLVGASGRPVVLLSHCGFDTDWWHTNDWKAAYEAVKPYNVVLYLYGHTGTGLRKWSPGRASAPLDCVNTGQTEKGFFAVQFTGGWLRLAYRLKRGREETLRDGKRRWVWDGTWEWRHLFEKKLRTNGAP